MFVVFGDMTDSFVSMGRRSMCFNGSRSYSEKICNLALATLTPEQLAEASSINAQDTMSMFIDEVTQHTVFFIGIGVGSWICGQIMGSCMMYSAARQTNKIRVHFFRGA